MSEVQSIQSSNPESLPVDMGEEMMNYRLSDLDYAITVSEYHDIHNQSALGVNETENSRDHALHAMPDDSIADSPGVSLCLNGLQEDLFAMNILNYLTAQDLCKLGITSKTFSKVTALPHLWKRLIQLDFSAVERESDSYSSRAVNASQTQIPNPSKQLYVKRYKEFQTRASRSRDYSMQQDTQRKREAQLVRYQKLLDFTQVRLLGPFFALAAFLIILLLAIKYDGNDIPIWACFFPVYVFAFYFGASIIVNYVVYRDRYQSRCATLGLWTNLRGPIRFMYVTALRENKTTAKLILVGLVVVMIQLVLVTIKLTGMDERASSTARHLSTRMSWAITFVPMWFLFACTLVTSCRRGSGGHLSALFIALIWIPFLILFVCLAVKLDREENGEGGRRNKHRIRLALILMPFWFLEGLMLVASVLLYFSTFCAG